MHNGQWNERCYKGSVSIIGSTYNSRAPSEPVHNGVPRVDLEFKFVMKESPLSIGEDLSKPQLWSSMVDTL